MLAVIAGRGRLCGPVLSHVAVRDPFGGPRAYFIWHVVLLKAKYFLKRISLDACNIAGISGHIVNLQFFLRFLRDAEIVGEYTAASLPKNLVLSMLGA